MARVRGRRPGRPTGCHVSFHRRGTSGPSAGRVAEVVKLRRGRRTLESAGIGHGSTRRGQTDTKADVFVCEFICVLYCLVSSWPLAPSRLRRDVTGTQRRVAVSDTVTGSVTALLADRHGERPPRAVPHHRIIRK